MPASAVCAEITEAAFPAPFCAAVPVRMRKEQEDLQEAVLEENTEDTEDTEDRAGDGQEKEEAEQEKIVVYVCGHVQAPGVYTLDMGSRIYDALAAAGGMSETAAPTYLNQAQLLTDGEKIYVPSAEEAEVKLRQTGPHREKRRRTEKSASIRPTERL